MREVVSGILIGLANLVPGISGGTIAVVLGIYEKLIRTIADTVRFKLNKEQFRFIIMVGIGLLSALLMGSKLMSLALDKATGFTYAAFFGLVLGTIPFLFKSLGKIKFGYIFVGIFLFVFVENIKFSFKVSGIFLPIAGFVAAFAMVMPGLSGSLVMLIFGVYKDIINAVSALNFAVLIPFGVGVVFGIAACTLFMKYLYERFPNQTKNFVFGLVVASLLKIQPFDKQTFSFYGYFLLSGVILFSFLFSLWFTKYAKQL
ncbi:MAG TPA: DUF368 domain-containing protein [Pseudothermotoga sp.]|uniref:DUF368 domain-containing protein n=1 Tax=Thermotoga profunda TaxID=1508420 RepID=UPI0005970CB2|nr:DUF368 domain-containing protein [Thermotoga profunda]